MMVSASHMASLYQPGLRGSRLVTRGPSARSGSGRSVWVCLPRASSQQATINSTAPPIPTKLNRSAMPSVCASVTKGATGSKLLFRAIESPYSGYALHEMTVVQDRLQSRLPAIGGQPATTMLRAAASSAPRVVWLDVLRVTAILAVITIHTVSPLTAGATVPTYSAAWWVGATMNVASLWCVPVFVMISGALLLSGADRTRQAATVFYRRRLHRIGIPLVFWTAVYLALRPTLFGEHFTGAQAIHDLAIGHPYLQMYYLFVIAGLYAVTPVLRHVVARCSPQRLMQVAVTVIAFDVVDYTLSSVGGAGGANALTEWLPFLGYFLAGAWLMTTPVRASTERRAATAAASSFAATVLLSALFIHIFGWTSVGRYFLGYQSPTVAVMSCGVFLWVRARSQQRGWTPRRAIARVSEATFGVFLIHPLVLVPLLQHFGRPSHVMTVALGVPAIVIGVAAVTTVTTLVLIRVPVLRRVVG